MAKVLYVDADLLNEYIEKSGLRLGYICDVMGLSYTGFNLKRSGKFPFKASEVYVLCDLLKIKDEDKLKIFTPPVEKTVNKEMAMN